MIAVPNGLIEQWMQEWRRFVKPNHVDIVPITGGRQSRMSWKDILVRSNLDTNRVVVLLSHSVCLSTDNVG